MSIEDDFPANQAYPVQIFLSHEDYHSLPRASAGWKRFVSNIEEDKGKFRDLETFGAPEDFDWQVINWFGAKMANFILAKAYLRARGEGYCAVYDASTNLDGKTRGYAILTDYDADAYRNLIY